MKYPEAKPLETVLRQLIRETPELTQDGSGGDIEGLGATYLSICHDDSGEPVAAIGADLSAALHLAGKLMMVPNGVLEEQAKAGKMEESFIDALSEVFNNLTKILNNQTGNPHVASRPAKETGDLKADAASAWVTSPSSRMDYTGEFAVGSGRLIVVAK